MRRILCPLCLLLPSLLIADSKAEADLRARLAKAEADRAALSLSLKNLSKSTGAATAGRATASETAAVNAEKAQTTADQNAAVARDTAEQARIELAVVKERLTQFQKSSSNERLLSLIGSGIAFLVLLVPVMLAFVKRSADHQAVMDKIMQTEQEARHAAEAAKRAEEGTSRVKENLETIDLDRKQVAKIQDGQLKQIHILVNSTLTKSIQDQVEAKQETLTLLEATIEANRRAGIEPTDILLTSLQVVKNKVMELQAQLADRKIQTENAEKQLHEDSHLTR